MLHLDFRSCVEEVMAAEMLSFGSSSIITRFYTRGVKVVVAVVVEVVIVVVIGEQMQ
jgi:hypothetical protein